MVRLCNFRTMRMLCILVYLVLMPGWSAAHPLHLSITNITYDDGKLMISMKTFKDDWETGYFHYHSKVLDFSVPSNREIPWFETYLKSRFKISLEESGPAMELKVDSVALNEGTLLIAMQCSLPSKPNSLYIYNALLTDIYPDQTNLVIFGFNKRETGIKFDLKKLGAEVLLN